MPAGARAGRRAPRRRAPRSTLSASRARVSSTSSTASRSAAGVAALGVLGAARRRGRRGGRARARRRRRRRGRGTTGRRAAARGRARRCAARRSARLMRSSYSVSRLRCSFLGRNASSSSRARLDRLARAPRPRSRGGVQQRLATAARAAVPAQRRARERLGGGAQRRPVAERRARARARRRRARAARTRAPRAGSTPRDCRRSATASAPSASKRTGWQREAIVGSTWRRAVGEQQQHDVGRRLLERLEQRVGRLVVHRVGALEHEHAPRRLERRVRGGGRRPPRRRRGAASRARRSARPRSGRGARRAPRARARCRGRGAPRRAARRRTRAPRRACRCPAGPVEQVGVRGRASGAERGAEHGGGVRMGARGRARRTRSASVAAHGRGRADHGRGARRRGQDDARRRASRRALRRDRRVLREPGGVELSERIRDAGQGPGARRSARAPRRCSTPPRARSSSRSGCGRGSTRGRLGAARPLRRLLARLPGRRAAGSGVEAVRALNAFAHRRPGARPHAAAARSTPRVGLARVGGRGEAPTASSEREASAPRAPPPTTSSPPPSRSAGSCSTPRSRPSAVLADALAQRVGRSRPGGPGARPRRRRSSSRGPSRGSQPSSRADLLAGGDELRRVAGAARLLARRGSRGR